MKTKPNCSHATSFKYKLKNMIGCWIIWSLFTCEKHAFVNFSVITCWWEASCLTHYYHPVSYLSFNPAAAELNITEWGFSTSVQWVLMSQNSGTVTGAVFTKKVFSVIHYTHLAAWRLNWTINLCLKTPDQHQNSEIKTGEQAASSSTAFTHTERHTHSHRAGQFEIPGVSHKHRVL